MPTYKQLFWLQFEKTGGHFFPSPSSAADTYEADFNNEVVITANVSHRYPGPQETLLRELYGVYEIDPDTLDPDGTILHRGEMSSHAQFIDPPPPIVAANLTQLPIVTRAQSAQNDAKVPIIHIADFSFDRSPSFDISHTELAQRYKTPDRIDPSQHQDYARFDIYTCRWNQIERHAPNSNMNHWIVYELSMIQLDPQTIRLKIISQSKLQYKIDGNYVYDNSFQVECRIDGTVYSVPLTVDWTGGPHQWPQPSTGYGWQGNDFLLYNGKAKDTNGGVRNFDSGTVTWTGYVDVPSAGSVFEIRNSDTYGDAWTEWQRMGFEPSGIIVMRPKSGANNRIEIDFSMIRTVYNPLEKINWRSHDTVTNVPNYEGEIRHAFLNYIPPDEGRVETHHMSPGATREFFVYGYIDGPIVDAETNANVRPEKIEQTTPIHEFIVNISGGYLLRYYGAITTALGNTSAVVSLVYPLSLTARIGVVVTPENAVLLLRPQGENLSTFARWFPGGVENAARQAAYEPAIAESDQSCPPSQMRDFSACQDASGRISILFRSGGESGGEPWRFLRSTDRGASFTKTGADNMVWTSEYRDAFLAPLVPEGMMSVAVKEDPLELWFRLSYDGATWTEPVKVCDLADAVSSFCAVWQNPRSGILTASNGLDVFYVSSDWGKIWTPKGA